MSSFYSIPSFNALRLRSYVLRLPLFTRACILLIFIFWILELQTVWNVTQWGSLIPKEVGLRSMYRTNTYPLVHLGFFHTAFNILAFTPLLERFEAEHGTLTTLALFAGPFGTLPAALYIFFDMIVLRRNTPVVGASIWIFLLLAVEATKTSRSNPYFNVISYKIPTWITPIVIAVLTSIFIPSVSFLGHLCGAAVGYLFGLNYLSYITPHVKLLRWIEAKLNLLGRLPHYVSIDQKTYGRYGVLPTTTTPGVAPPSPSPSHRAEQAPVPLGWVGTGPDGRGQRLGP